MSEIEEVLSLDLKDNDYLYRIRRGKRVVYIWVLYADIVPLDDRIDGSRILSNLRSIPKWNEQWKMLIVTKSHNGVECAINKFLPYTLNYRTILTCSDRRYNLLDLKRCDRISDRVSQVLVYNRECVLKIARFKHELVALEREIRAYYTLMNHKFTLTPEFIGYAYKEEEDRVIGFLMEEIHRRHLDIRDLRTCQSTVQQLHSIGIIHRDLNRYNIIIIGDEVRLIDFEASTLQKEGHHIEARDEL
jgi:serine/threonine protein kinase